MSTMNPLVEFILAHQKKGGEKLARFGTQHYTIPLMPPNTPLAFRILPYFGAYCNIYFWNRWSASIVPNTIYYETIHKGVLFHEGLLSTTAFTEGHNLWFEVTNTNFVTTRLINQSPIYQYYEGADVFLVVQTEADLMEIHELIRTYIRDPLHEKRVEEVLNSINQKLGMPPPRPPIGGR